MLEYKSVQDMEWLDSSMHMHSIHVCHMVFTVWSCIVREAGKGVSILGMDGSL